MRLGVFFVSTSDLFMNQPLATLARWLQDAGIRSVLLQLPAHSSTDAAHARVLLAHGIDEVVLRTDGRDIAPETIRYELTRRHGSSDTWERVIREHPHVRWWVEVGNEPDMDFGPGYRPVAPARWRAMLARAADGIRDLTRSLGLKTIAAMPTSAPQTRVVLEDGEVARRYDAVAVHVYGHERMGDNQQHAENLALVEADPNVQQVVLTEVGINGPGVPMVEKCWRIRAWAEAYQGKATLAIVFCTGTKDWDAYRIDSPEAFQALGRERHAMADLWYPGAIRYQAKHWSPGGQYGRTWPGTVDMIIEHHTVGRWDSVVHTFTNGTRRASAHFLVGRDGRIAQFASLADIAWHANNWPVNVRSVGIEHEHYQVGGRWTEWTAAQLEASATLHRWLMERMPRVTVKRHYEVSEEPTSCPLDLPVEEILRRASGKEQPMDDPNAWRSEATGHWVINQGQIRMLDEWRKRGGIEGLGHPLSGMWQGPDGVYRQLFENGLLEVWPQGWGPYPGPYARLGGLGQRFSRAVSQRFSDVREAVDQLG